MDGSLPWPKVCVPGAAGVYGNGPAAPAGAFDVNTTVAPFWLAEDPQTLADAVDGWAMLAARPTDALPLVRRCPRELDVSWLQRNMPEGRCRQTCGCPAPANLPDSHVLI